MWDPQTGGMRPPLPRDPAAAGLLTRVGSASEVRGLVDTLQDTPSASPPFSGRPLTPPTESLHLEGPSPDAPHRVCVGGSPHGRSLWADHRATDSEGGVGVGGTGRAVSSAGDCSKTIYPGD